MAVKLNGAVTDEVAPDGSVCRAFASTLPPAWPAATVMTPVEGLMAVPLAMVALPATSENVTFDAVGGTALAENDRPGSGGTVTRAALTLALARRTKGAG